MSVRLAEDAGPLTMHRSEQRIVIKACGEPRLACLGVDTRRAAGDV